MTPISLRLKELRQAAGLSQQELSALSGVRQGTISDFETGRGRRRTLEVLDRLAAALGVTPADLLAYTPPKKPGERRPAAKKGKRG